MDFVMGRELPVINRSPVQHMLNVACTIGQILRAIWKLMGYNLATALKMHEGSIPCSSRRRRRRHRQVHHYDQGGDGDFLRNDEKFLTEEDEEPYYPRLVTAVCGFPKDSDTYPLYKHGKFGEDAWFTVSSRYADTLGVADGVGGWRSYGIDAGQFSMFFMRSCRRLASHRNFNARILGQLLSYAYLDILEQKCPVLGGCTACLVSLDREESSIYTANIGDSGFLAVRDGCILAKSYEQQHQFNMPYQLTAPPPCLSNSCLMDSPDCAIRQQFETRPGDMVLLGSDGVFDNVPLDLMLFVLDEMSGVDDPALLQMAANSLALIARCLSRNPVYDSPFSQHARKLNILSPGGKPDDITVIVASVV